jgi:hypothetical protein
MAAVPCRRTRGVDEDERIEVQSGDEGQVQSNRLVTSETVGTSGYEKNTGLETCSQFFEWKGSCKRHIIHANEMPAIIAGDSTFPGFTIIGCRIRMLHWT